jgi:hypothetical protein
MVNAPSPSTSRLPSAHQDVLEQPLHRTPYIPQPPQQLTAQHAQQYANMPNFYPRMQTAPSSVEPFLSQTPYQHQQQRTAPPQQDRIPYMPARFHQPGQAQYFWDPIRQQPYQIVPPDDGIPTPPPPPPIHRVYHLRCASCETFLSDRGMRVRFFSVHFLSFSTGELTFPPSSRLSFS